MSDPATLEPPALPGHSPEAIEAADRIVGLLRDLLLQRANRRAAELGEPATTDADVAAVLGDAARALTLGCEIVGVLGFEAVLLAVKVSGHASGCPAK